jgi:hypothetical protein
MRAIALAACCAASWSVAAAAGEPLPVPPSDLVERTRGAWIDVYRSWLERPEGNALPVDPGPAFCVGADGFAVVDQNAVAGSVHLFATILGRGPFAARARAFDPASGIAAIQINPKALEGVRCLPRAGEDAPPVAAGDVLFALGPAGAEPVALRVKKISPAELSFADGLQGTFLAGSPLVDAGGLLRGVLVAGAAGGTIGREKATGSFAGLTKWRHATVAIPVAAALTLVDQVKQQQAAGMPVPPPDPVVQVSAEVFPRPLRRAAGPTAEELALYSATAGDVSVEFLTPSSLEALQANDEYAYAPGRTFFLWMGHTQMWEPMVVVQQSPRLDGTSGSKESEASIAVERGGERIEPYDSFADLFENYVTIESEPGTYDSRTVRGRRTFYLFPPGAFAPGADVTVRVTENQQGKTRVVPVRPETQARIAADFAPWEAAVREAASAPPAPSQDAVVAPVPAIGVPYATRSLGNPELRVTKPAGWTFVVTLRQRAGKPVIRIPVVNERYRPWTPVSVPGFLYVGRDEISFEPVKTAGADPKYAFTLRRADLAVSTTVSRALRIKGDGQKWLFRPGLEVTQKVTLGDVFGSTFSEAQSTSVEFAVTLLGDFDQALRAFESPEVLAKPPAPPAPDKSTTSEEFP